MAMDKSEVQAWLESLPEGVHIGINDDAMALCVVGDEDNYCECGAMPQPKLPTVRVELPVMLYVDVDLNKAADKGQSPLDAAKEAIYYWLGRPGEEQGDTINDGALEHLGLSHARIYPSDLDICDTEKHFAVVDDFDGM
jgi:hypothetical protein